MREQYKLILVDDEDDIRGRIHAMINKETGFEVVASASNGYDALELIEQHRPDAVITDIRMPYINGLELTKEIRTEFSNVKVLFLTGYGEFDYARKAVDLDVVSYIMKPATTDDVHQALVKLKDILDEEYNLVHNIELLEENIEKNKQLFIEKQLNMFLMQSDVDASDLEALQIYGLSFKAANYIIGIIEFYNNTSVRDVLQSETFIREYFETALHQYENIIPFDTSEGLAFIIKSNQLARWEIEFTLTKMLSSKLEQSPINLRIGLSTIFNDFKSFSSKYHEASNALSISRFTNTGQIISYEDIKNEIVHQAVLSTEHIKELEYVIRFENEELIHDTIEKLITQGKKHSGNAVDYQLYIISVANIIMGYALSLGIEMESHFPSGLLHDLLELNSIEDILRYTERQILKLRRKTIDRANTRLEELADQVVLFMEQKYNDSQINMDYVAEQFNISVSYLSSVLKKEKGISFNKYLIQLRIQQAKELLKCTDLKIVEIAKKVGYNDVYYFSYSFKKNTKMSPKEYREHA